MQKYKFGILLAATKDSAFTIGTLLLNILHKMPNQIDVFYIVQDGFCDLDKRIMQEIVESRGGGGVKLVFVDFTFEDFSAEVKKYNPNFYIDKTNPILSRYTHMSYARFEALKFLCECEKIVYLDFDMLLLRGIEELAQGDFDVACFRGSASLGALCPPQFKEVKNYSTGIIVFGSMALVEMYAFVYRFIAEHCEDYFTQAKLGDQALFSLYLLTNPLKIYELGDKYYGNVSWVKSKESSIIHAWGQHNRFWNNKLCALAWGQWWVYYHCWLELGGSAYNRGWKAKLEVPLSGGEVWQYFERIAWAKQIMEIPMESYELIVQVDFKNKLKFTFAGIDKSIFLQVYSKSIYTFVLEFCHKENVITSKTINRKDLNSFLPQFIESQMRNIGFVRNSNKEEKCVLQN
ncbi:glycosyltransferase [Helicobacter sp. UBA3407]|uniref:glycosyltransferase n=1 Tax=Helicobacter sp. UBA3407 TaxID=1946588 RepID=UPI00260EC1F3|nr:glycosyltransferase [Helicobacter sp. UBA3407]